MSAALTQVMTRLFCCGILCGVAMILSGDSPAKEITRICSAALMIISLLSCLRVALPELDLVADTYRADIERQINATLAAGEEERRSLLQTEVGARLRANAARLGVDCDFSVIAATDGSSVKKVVIAPRAPCTSDMKSAVITMAAEQCGIARAEITWRDE